MPNSTPEFQPLDAALKQSISHATYAPKPNVDQQKALHALEKTTRQGKIEHLLGMVADVAKFVKEWKPEAGGRGLDYVPEPLLASFLAGRGADRLRKMNPANLQRVVDTLDPRTRTVTLECGGQKTLYATRESCNLDPSQRYIQFDAGNTPPSYVDFEHERVQFGGRQFSTAELKAALYGHAHPPDYNIVPSPRDKDKPSLVASIFIPDTSNPRTPNPPVLVCFMSEAEMRQFSTLFNAPLPVRPPPLPGAATMIRRT